MRFSFALLFCFTFSYSLTSFGFDQSHAHWNTTLKRYQNDKGLIAYQNIKYDLKSEKDHPFAQYLNDIQKVKMSDFNGFNKNQQMAFLINAYNALTVKLIVDHYPVESIKEIGGWFSKPWSVEFFSLLDGKLKSLDPIEHKWLRPKYKDYRIHAAVNCASISCPPLRREAYVGDKLEAQLDDQMRFWLKDNTRNQIKPNSDVWHVSKIFDWYESDFKNWGGSVPHVINKYIAQPIDNKKLNKINIKYLNYDWNLNAQK